MSSVSQPGGSRKRVAGEARTIVKFEFRIIFISQRRGENEKFKQRPVTGYR